MKNTFDELATELEWALLMLDKSRAQKILAQARSRSSLQIETVIRNLVSNAIKFSFPGDKITVSARSHKTMAYVMVEDSGVGIPESDIPHLFGGHSSIMTQGTQNEKGTGLGLILCKEFIEKHGGCISVTSEPNVSTVFSFCIPAKEK